MVQRNIRDHEDIKSRALSQLLRYRSCVMAQCRAGTWYSHDHQPELSVPSTQVRPAILGSLRGISRY
jgi:hypothetical protein